MQQQVQQLRQRVDQIENRAQQMTRTMAQEMERLRIREGDREQTNLMLQLGEGVSAQVRDTKRAVDELETMVSSGTMARDRDTLRDMDRLRDHLSTVTEGLNKMVTTMEAMRKRLQAEAGAGR
jgi:uncharacterized protein Yka (UPF0111/DUF47 family)